MLVVDRPQTERKNLFFGDVKIRSWSRRRMDSTQVNQYLTRVICVLRLWKKYFPSSIKSGQDSSIFFPSSISGCIKTLLPRIIWWWLDGLSQDKIEHTNKTKTATTSFFLLRPIWKLGKKSYYLKPKARSIMLLEVLFLTRIWCVLLLTFCLLTSWGGERREKEQGINKWEGILLSLFITRVIK